MKDREAMYKEEKKAASAQPVHLSSGKLFVFIYTLSPYAAAVGHHVIHSPRVGQLFALNDGSLDSRLCFRACPADEKPHDGDR